MYVFLFNGYLNMFTIVITVTTMVLIPKDEWNYGTDRKAYGSGHGHGYVQQDSQLQNLHSCTTLFFLSEGLIHLANV